MEFLANPQLTIIFQLILAAFFGALIGLEREYIKKEAGLRTFCLVCLGATLFTSLTHGISDFLIEKQGIVIDPTRIIGQIVVGVGFLGAGLIIFRQARVEGLTTAAALWVTAAIGAAIGVEFYFLAAFTTLLTILVLTSFRLIEEKFLGTKEPDSYDK